MPKRILLIGGSMNQTKMMYKISRHLEEFECVFSPFYYEDGYIGYLSRKGFLDSSILGGVHKKTTEKFLEDQKLKTDFGGHNGPYDLAIIGTDTIVPKNLEKVPTILVQEGMFTPENWRYHLVRRFGLPHYIADTGMMGLSHKYDHFCVAGEGFKEIFSERGIPASKMSATGIPNFDNFAAELGENPIKEEGFVLGATSALRESYKYENRKAFIKKTRSLANGRPIIFKLHPNENYERANAEIKKIIPEATVYTDININYFIARCNAMVTKYSSVIMVALALDIKVYSDLPEHQLMKLKPIQNGGRSAERIAAICKTYL